MKTKRIPYLVTLVAVLLFACSESFAKGNCTDISVTITVAQGTPTGGASAMFGDGAVPYSGSDSRFSGGTMYQDGVGGVYAKFQTCNGTNDLILNSANTQRYLNYDFTQPIASAG